MKYAFPIIAKLDDILPHVENMPEIAINYDEHYTSITYNVQMADTFPDPKSASSLSEEGAYAMRRECRGIKFHPVTGAIMARPFHKFFNLNEKDETQDHVLEQDGTFDSPFHILDKLDGSMIYPILTNGGLEMCTKRGITDISKQAFDWMRESDLLNSTHYVEFCEMMVDVMGITPIFEWVGRGNRIVVDYPESSLILIAARYMVSGDYVSMPELKDLCESYTIPLVEKWDGTFDGISKFCDIVKDNTGEEGYVIRFAQTGHMLKIKNLWYIKIHRAKDAVRFEKDVIGMILREELDDILPELEEADRDRLTSFSSSVVTGVLHTQQRINSLVTQAKGDAVLSSATDLTKWFATTIVPTQPKIEHSLLFKAWSGCRDLRGEIVGLILKNLSSSTRVERVRELIGNIRYEDF